MVSGPLPEFRAQPGLLGEAGLGSTGLRAEAAGTLKPGLQSMHSVTFVTCHTDSRRSASHEASPDQGGGHSLHLCMESYFKGDRVSWDERNWCHSKPPLLASPGRVQTSNSAWLTGWVSGDQIPRLLHQ